MAQITVVKGREVVSKVQLKREVYLIGRHESSDIFLDNVMVSRKHALLSREGGVWNVKDISGGNGIYINGEQKAKHIMRNGDKVEIGKFLLTFNQSRDDLERDMAMAKNEAGAGFKASFDEMNAAAHNMPEKIQKGRAPEEVDTSASTMALPPEELKRIREETQRRRSSHLQALTPLAQAAFGLDREEITIGKDKNCSIVVPGGLTIGKRHATISKYGDHWFIEHQSGMSGTKVNGQKITQKTKLGEGDEIEVGSARLKFIGGI